VLTFPSGALSTSTPSSCWTTRKVKKTIRVVRAETFESSAVSNINGFPDEQPFITHFLRCTGRYSALFAASQPGNELKKCWINTERIGEKGRPGSRIRRKKERRTKVATKTSSLVLELMARLETHKTPTKICEVQTTSAPQNCLPSAWGARILHSSSGVMDLSAAYLAHDLLSGFYGQRCCDKSNRGM
jgi:hypothetical protein